MLELARFEPMNGYCVNSDSFFRSNIGTILKVVMLPLLLCFQIEASQPSQVLLAYSFINCSASPNTLSVVVSSVRPPVSLRFDISDDHVFYGYWESRYLPRDVGLPATPRFTQMLENSLCFVCFHSLRHHIINVHDDGGAEFKIILTLNTLFGDGLSDSLRMATFKLPG